MNNAVTVLIYDRTEAQSKLSQQTVESALKQDIPVDVFIIDNGSTCQKTKDWLYQLNWPGFAYKENISPIVAMNFAMSELFGKGYPHILGCPNDVILPPNLYRRMLEWEQEVVAPGMHGTNPPEIMEGEITRVHGDVHMSVALVRKSGYDKMVAKYGNFYDPGYFMYASDCDLKMRIVDCGVTTAQLDILCWHYGGASHRLAVGGQPYEQADIDRAYFEKKWGHPISSEQYGEKIQKLG